MNTLITFRDSDFQWYETLPGKQSVRLKEGEQYQTPADIIGYGKHLEIVKQHLKDWDTPRMNGWAEEDRKIVAKIYATLRRHGWYDPGLDEFGRICFGSPYSSD